ncbi:hypothetical protein Fmac_025359 [Flemingia macrophylla]|uniref:Reverse transcriptase domain-containing protein n=1 Tax=Flemingia macrophylla TaxID=520843 RepID=A0ABD1LS57_9FABA
MSWFRLVNIFFFANFYILDMEEGFSHSSIPIILGKPFLKTGRTKIDVHVGTLSMEFSDIVVQFNILDAMKHPFEDHSIFRVELLDELVDEHIFDSFYDHDFPSLTDLYTCLTCIESKSDILDVVHIDFIKSKCINHVVGLKQKFDLLIEVQAAKPIPTSLVPSIVQPPPTLELKPLPENLKYAYLEDDEKLPVIISTSLMVDQEEKLLQVLKKHKKAIGWTLANIPGISPSMCMYKILLKDEAKPVRQTQRRLNPMIIDVMKKEVTKFFQAVIIYPISVNHWVSPVQVAPRRQAS